ncbi:MAG: hypothetical protein IJ367_01040, partial [Clostridia bacterium]|nr:hypothetical protein [Clostridia bacterium]
MQAEISGVLEANPNAKVILRVHVNPPYWWLRDNPDEQVLYNGVPGTDDGESYRLIRGDGERNMRVSLASEKWLKEAGERLAEFCRELSQTKEGESLIGIQVACGVYGEWHQWGIDTGKPMRERFVRYLKETYHTEEALQKAWNCTDITFETAPFCPDPEAAGDFGIFRDPRKSRCIIDSQMCLQQTVPEAILHFCRIIRENWNGDILTGAFYGYFMSRGSNMQVIMGHMMPEILFENKECIDFLCGPFPYMENRMIDGTPMSRAFLESMRIHNILWLTEMDQHPVGSEQYPGGDPLYRDETIAMLRRNILLPICCGMGAWYYDHRVVPACVELDRRDLHVGSVFLKRGWWDSEHLLSEIGKLQEIALNIVETSLEPEAEILLVYDTKTYFYQSEFATETYEIQDAFARSGATFDCVYLSDLPQCDIERYKVIVFINAHVLTEEQKKKIAIVTQDKTVLWLFASGICNG